MDYGSAHLHSRAELVGATGWVRCEGGRRSPPRSGTRRKSSATICRGSARLNANETGIRVAAASGRYGPTERQIAALSRARGAMQAVGLALGGVLSWVVISGATISDYAEVKHVRKQRACEMLKACLDRLADFYSRGEPG
jgi:hypothetical protein